MSLLPSWIASGILGDYYFFWVMSRPIQDCDQSIKTQFFALYAPIKLIMGFSKIWHLHALMKTNACCHQACNSLSTNQIRYAKNCGHSIMALVSPKLSSHLLQFMSFYVVLLLQENHAPFVKILFALVMLT